VQAGKLNRKVSILQQTESQDSYGQPVSSWAPIYSCFASIEIQNSQLIYATAEFVAKVTYRITFRWTASVNVTPNMRIGYTNAANGVTHIYEIQTLINTDERNREVVALAYELDGSA
jgi:SPP1 family predicted phage head-tail adaptor